MGTITAAHHDHHPSSDETDLFGFWIYILSDCILFASLFATFAALHNNIYTGPSLRGISDLRYVFIETLALLVSSFTYGLTMMNAYKQKLKPALLWLSITGLFGLLFIGMELNEFINLAHEGMTWQTSAAFSAFFTLVGTHGLHVSIGLLWMGVLFFQLCKEGFTPSIQRRLNYLGIFWAFLDIIWIFVFTTVYLMGAA